MLKVPSLKWNVISGAALLFVQLAVSFLIAPFFLRILGAESYGAWELIIALLGYASLLEFGLGAAMIRETAAADGAGDSERVSLVFSNAAFVLGLAGVLAFLLLAAASPFAGPLMGARSQMYSQTALATLITAVNVLVTFGVSILAALAMGMRQFFFLNTFRMFSISLSAAVTFLVLSTWPEHGLVNLALVACVGNIIQAVVLVGLIRSRMRLRFSRSFISWFEIRKLFRFGISSSLLESSSKIVNGAAPFLVSHLLGLATVPYFAIGKRLVEYGYSLASAIGNPLMPHFASKAGNVVALRESWMRATKILQLITLAMPVALYLFAPAFISLWMGAEFAERSTIVVRILSVGMLFQAVSCNCGALIVSKGMHGRLAKLAMLSAVPCLAVTAALGYQFGLAGIAIGLTGFPALLSVWEVRLANDILGQSFATGQWLTVRPYLLPLLGMLAAGSALLHFQPPQTFPLLIIDAALCGATYFGLALLLSFSFDERRAIFGIAARVK